MVIVDINKNLNCFQLVVVVDPFAGFAFKAFVVVVVGFVRKLAFVGLVVVVVGVIEREFGGFQ